jgi:aminopeptidase N
LILPPDDSNINFPTALLVHETSHMWTGDVATCSWWDVAWLNEGMTHFFTHWIGSQVRDI